MDSFAAFKHSRRHEIRRAKLMGLKVSFIPSNPDIKPELMPRGMREKEIKRLAEKAPV